MHTKYQPVARFKKGIGRDFVVGDIHGAFDLLEEGLGALDFDVTQDRLFSVGDLVDRGKYSPMALTFLKQPWFHAVRGNHEDMILDMYKDGSLDVEALSYNVYRNGMEWWLHTSPYFREDMLQQLKNLPLAVEVETRIGEVGLIHAEVPIGMEWDTFIADLEAGEAHTIQNALWSRTRAHGRASKGVPGIKRVYSGHTPMFSGVQSLGNCIFLDTGAVFGVLGSHPGKLSIVAIDMELPAKPVAVSKLVYTYN